MTTPSIRSPNPCSEGVALIQTSACDAVAERLAKVSTRAMPTVRFDGAPGADCSMDADP